VHLIRNSLKYVPRREFADVTRDLKPIYTAIDADAAQVELERFDEKWGARFPVITQAWLDSWEYVTPFLAFPPEVRRVIYTTNAIEALNRQLRKAVKTKGHFPSEDAARKAALPRDPKRRPAVDSNPELDDSAAGIQDPLRRPPTRLTKTRLHRKRDTLIRHSGSGSVDRLGLLAPARGGAVGKLGGCSRAQDEPGLPTRAQACWAGLRFC
jgi:hypothetical protein